MFERYAESARRALFFARYAVSELGAAAIEPEHILLGLLRDRHGLVGKILGDCQISEESVRREIESRAVVREKIAPSVEVPFAPATERALAFAAEEADRLNHSYIGEEHLLLNERPPMSEIAWAHTGAASEIDAIKQWVDQLAGMAAGSVDAQDLADRIRQALDGVKRRFSG